MVEVRNTYIRADGSKEPTNADVMKELQSLREEIQPMLDALKFLTYTRRFAVFIGPVFKFFIIVGIVFGVGWIAVKRLLP